MNALNEQRERLKRCLRLGVEELPVLPAVATQLMALNRNADDFPERVLELIESEPSYAARILGAANSAASGSRVEITSLRQAIVRLGSAQAARIVTALAVTRVFAPQTAWEKGLWRHSLQVAIASRALAQAARDPSLSPDEAYPAGLLHDIGRFIMFQEAPESLRQVDEGNWDTPETLVAAERHICGLTHGDLGAAACLQWGLPEPIVTVIRNHHRPRGRSARREVPSLLLLVQFADLAMFPAVRGDTSSWAMAGEDRIKSELMPRLPGFLKLDAGALLALLSRAEAEADMLARLVGV